MENNKVSKRVVAIIVVVLIFVLLAFFSCSQDSSKEDNASQPRSIFRTETPTTTRRNISTVPTTTQSIPHTPFTKLVQEAFYELPTIGTVDLYSPGSYTSPRWEAILGGDPSSGIPINELDKAINSDLDPTTFDIARQTAIDVTRAHLTGEGVERWPSYFEGIEIGTCTEFSVKHAGATSLPFASDNRWITSYIIWDATCPVRNSQTKNKISQSTRVYFTVDNGALNPHPSDDFPTS